MDAMLAMGNDDRQRLIAELAKKQAYILQLERALGEAWTPVGDGYIVPTVTDDEVWAYERDGKLGKAIVIRKDHFHGDIILADGYALCRRTSSS